MNPLKVRRSKIIFLQKQPPSYLLTTFISITFINKSMFRDTYIVILLLFSFLILCAPLSSPMQVSYNNRHVFSSSIQLNTTQFIGSMAQLMGESVSFKVTYPAILATPASSKVVLGLEGVNINFPQNQIQFSVKQTARHSSFFEITLFTNFSGNINKMAVRYLILTNQYSETNDGNLFVDNFVINVQNNVSLDYTHKQNLNYPGNFNTTNGIASFCSLIGMDITLVADIFDILVDINATSLTQFTLSLGSNSNNQTFVQSIEVYILLYNKQYFVQPHFAIFHSGIIRSSSSSRQLKYTNKGHVFSSTTMLGLVSFSSDLVFDFDTSFQEPDSFTVASSTSGNLNFYGVSYLLLSTFHCDPRTPYSYELLHQCYDACPLRTYQNQTYQNCQNCPFDCMTCDGKGGCLSCDNSSNLTGQRCIPQNKSQGSASIPPCPKGCSICLSSTSSCTACIEGYTLSKGKCQTQKNSSTLAVVFLLLFILVFGLLLLVLCCACSKSEEKEVSQGEEVDAEVKVNDEILSERKLQQIGMHLESSINAEESNWREIGFSAKAPELCSVCLEFTVCLEASCGHNFHPNCLADLAKKNTTCPSCYENLRTLSFKMLCISCFSMEKEFGFGAFEKNCEGGICHMGAVCPNCSGSIKGQ